MPTKSAKSHIQTVLKNEVHSGGGGTWVGYWQRYHLGLVRKMITNDNKGTYLVKNGQKHDNVIYERPLIDFNMIAVLENE